MNKSLIVLSPLLPGESLSSLLYRLSDVAGYHSQQVVIQLCRERLTQKDRVTYPFNSDTFEIISELTRIEAEALYRASIQFFAFALVPPHKDKQRLITLPSGHEVPVFPDYGAIRTHLFPDSNVQFCPFCLKGSPHHHLAWTPRVSVVCLTHQCLLVQRCPGCGKKVRVQDIVRGRCQECQFCLADAPVISVADDEFGLFSQSAIQYWLGTTPRPDNYDLYSLLEQPPSALYYFLDGLRRFLMGWEWKYLYQSATVKPSTSRAITRKGLPPSHHYLVYATLVKGVINWPEGFYEFLDTFKYGDDPRPYIEFGSLSPYWLRRTWLHPAFQFVQDAFDEYVKTRYPGRSTHLRS